MNQCETATGAGTEPKGSGASQALCLLLVLAVLGMRTVLPVLPVAVTPLSSFIAGLAYTVALVALAIELAALMGPHVRETVVLCGLAAVLWLGCAVLGPRLGMSLALIGLKDLGLLLFATMGGALLSRVAREPKIIAPIAVTVALVDVVGVLSSGGFTAQMLERHPEVVEAASVAVPSVGMTVPGPGAEGPSPLLAQAFVGVGDVLFLGFFFAAVGRFGMNLRGSEAVAICACLVAMGLVLAGVRSLPGLPFIAAGCVAVNLRYFRYTRAEMMYLAIAALFVLFFCGAILANGILSAPPEPQGMTPP